MSERDASEAIAHLPHPSGAGALCGRPPTRLRPCKSCLARRASLIRVHVQSPRKTSEAFCGISLVAGAGGGGDQPRDIAPMYVRAEQARTLLSSGSGLEFCPGCRGNLERHDDAARQRTQRIVGDPGLPAARVVRDGRAPNGRILPGVVVGKRRRSSRPDPPGLTGIPEEDP